jgi:pimeloyl-ACP methyl ester carboxylesterase
MTATVVDRPVSLVQDRVRTKVREAGEGPPLVYLHGAGGLMWDPLVESLTETHHLYAPMHPGTDGEHHDDIRELREIWDLVLYYAELFDELGLDRAVLVGHSIGAMVAAEIAATYPKFVEKLVLVSPLGLWRDDVPVGNPMMLDPMALVQATFADVDGPAAQAMIHQMTNMLDDPEAAVESWWTTACTGHFIWPLPDRGLGKRIHRITAPTLVIWGQQDGIISPIYAEEFGSRIANAQVEVLDGAAHVPQLEQPERVIELVRGFLGTDGS